MKLWGGLPFGNIFTLGGGSTPQMEHIWKFKNKQVINNLKNAVFRFLIPAFIMYIWRNHGCTEILINVVKHMKGNNIEYDEKRCGFLAKITETKYQN